MRSYHLDEIRPEDTARLGERLAALGLHQPLPGIYWLPLPPELLSPEQSAHREECGTHVLPLELGEDYIRLELLVRADRKLRCSCVNYADKAQRDWAIAWMDDLVLDLGVLT